MNPTTFVLPQGAWSHGKEIIASNGAILPPYCIKCGRPAEPNFFRKQFSWHQSWVYFFILVAILVYAILAATLSKRMTLRLPLCAKHLEKYRSLKIASALLRWVACPK